MHYSFSCSLAGTDLLVFIMLPQKQQGLNVDSIVACSGNHAGPYSLQGAADYSSDSSAERPAQKAQ